FQAEDGIRDATVTGVQTCALPICLQDVLTDAINVRRRSPHMLRGVDGHLVSGRAVPAVHRDVDGSAGQRAKLLEKKRQQTYRTRSEERRVGKEGETRRAVAK